ncbi:MAG: hypothetical protein ACYS76_11165 [Planctomycetota bacterium]
MTRTLDHRELDDAKEMEFDEDRWNWAHESDDHDYSYFDIETPGLHTISLSMHEDGLIVDKIILTTNPDYRPDGMGPAASTRSITRWSAERPVPGIMCLREAP